MTILETIIKELKTDNKIQQMMELCSTIALEENPKCKYPEKLPQGPNIFLSIEIPAQQKRKINYLTLERESEDAWIIVLYTILKKNYSMVDEYPKKTRAFVINDHRPVKILTDFAKKVKYFRGE